MTIVRYPSKFMPILCNILAIIILALTIVALFFPNILSIRTETYLEIEMISEANGKLDIFWLENESQGFNQSKMKRFDIKTGSSNTLFIPIPQSALLDRLRIDPIDSMSKISIKNIRTIKKNCDNTYSVHDLKLADMHQKYNVNLMEIDNGFVINPTSDDPVLVLNLNSSDSNVKCMLSPNYNIKFANGKFPATLILVASIAIIIFIRFLLILKKFSTIVKSLRLGIFPFFGIMSLVTIVAIFSVRKSADSVFQNSNFSVGHMNYYGLSKLADQIDLALIILAPSAFLFACYVLAKFFHKERNL